jgi:hypothetical protein
MLNSGVPQKSSPFTSVPWAMVAAFGAYFCMYGFRKPFTAGLYEDSEILGLGYKSVLVISQTLGYALSKLIGIKIVSEIKPENRARGILIMIAIAWLMLLGFGLCPRPYNLIFLFGNGLPLGMVFGLVLGYLEGRRMTEALVAGLCASFILADGFTKSVGTYLLKQGISEDWMPFISGLLFALPLLLFVWMLTKIPGPDEKDRIQRSERSSMSRADRRNFFRKYAPGLVALSVSYLMGTLLRSLRADFAPEIWKGLGYSGIPSIYTSSELCVLLAVVVINGLGILFTDNRLAFRTSLIISIIGFAGGLASIWAVGQGLNGYLFMIAIGTGIYIPYVAVHTTVFERLIAMTRDKGNIGFLMYVSDTVGYVGYVCIMFAKGRLKANDDFLAFYLQFSTITISIGILSLLLTFWYFRKIKTSNN